MREETKKLIEQDKVVLKQDGFGDTDVIFVSDIQQIIDCETKPLHEEIEKLNMEIKDSYAKIVEAKAEGYSFGRAEGEKISKGDIQEMSFDQLATLRRIQDLENERNNAINTLSKVKRDLRDEFAMRAPEVPDWFKRQHSSLFTDEDVYFKWRFYYADQMMKQREL